MTCMPLLWCPIWLRKWSKKSFRTLQLICPFKFHAWDISSSSIVDSVKPERKTSIVEPVKQRHCFHVKCQTKEQFYDILITQSNGTRLTFEKTHWFDTPVLPITVGFPNWNWTNFQIFWWKTTSKYFYCSAILIFVFESAHYLIDFAITLAIKLMSSDKLCVQNKFFKERGQENAFFLLLARALII